MAARARGWSEEIKVAQGRVLGTPDFTRPHLGTKERAVVRAIAEALLGGEVEADRLDTIEREVDLYLGVASTFVRLGLRALLLVVRLTPLFLFVALRGIERLDLERRTMLLERLERTRFVPLSLTFVAWRTIILLVAYDDPKELEHIGYVHQKGRHKRHLSLLESGTRTIPALESGVRLKDNDSDDDSVSSLPSARSA